jgi:hypothetical protein
MSVVELDGFRWINVASFGLVACFHRRRLRVLRPRYGDISHG